MTVIPCHTHELIVLAASCVIVVRLGGYCYHFSTIWGGQGGAVWVVSFSFCYVTYHVLFWLWYHSSQNSTSSWLWQLTGIVLNYETNWENICVTFFYILWVINLQRLMFIFNSLNISFINLYPRTNSLYTHLVLHKTS